MILSLFKWKQYWVSNCRDRGHTKQGQAMFRCLTMARAHPPPYVIEAKGNSAAQTGVTSGPMRNLAVSDLGGAYKIQETLANQRKTALR